MVIFGDASLARVRRSLVEYVNTISTLMSFLVSYFLFNGNIHQPTLPALGKPAHEISVSPCSSLSSSAKLERRYPEGGRYISTYECSKSSHWIPSRSRWETICVTSMRRPVHSIGKAFKSFGIDTGVKEAKRGLSRSD